MSDGISDGGKILLLNYLRRALRKREEWYLLKEKSVISLRIR